MKCYSVEPLYSGHVDKEAWLKSSLNTEVGQIYTDVQIWENTVISGYFQGGCLFKGGCFQGRESYCILNQSVMYVLIAAIVQQ